MSHTPEDLGQRIKAAQEKEAKAQAPSSGSGAASSPGASAALRAATDLVSAVAVGGFLGYWLDQWLGWKPFGMIVFIFVGFIAGFMNIYRTQTGQTYKVGFKGANDEQSKK